MRKNGEAQLERCVLVRPTVNGVKYRQGEQNKY